MRPSFLHHRWRSWRKPVGSGGVALLVAGLLGGLAGSALVVRAQSGATDAEPAQEGVAEPTASAAIPPVEAAAPPTRPSSGTPDSRSYERFRLIEERNIFNSERRKPLPAGRTPPPEPTRPPRTQTISLNGTICYESKAFAFLGGSESEFRGIFSPGDKVGNLTLATVDSHGVTLTGGEAPLRVPVGQGLQRSGDDPWRVSSVTSGAFASSNSTGDRRPSSVSGSPPADNPAAAAESGGAESGGMSEIMRRMMERRRAQTGQ
ncbi:MAG: hypothetical protein H7A45_04325 [Verrucomicrobiales bacterium]|nr:hypothetical protein [Verrucomicrobiales bacterium]MCP5528433.1 hypothetical protein [Verrucomicrobiales bacterium]